MKNTHKNIALGGAGLSLFIIAAIVLMVLTMAGKPNWPVDVIVDTPYAFATPQGATTAAAFFTVKNGLAEDDKLISASSDVSNIVEIHENLIDPDDGTMMMRKIKALDVPAGKKTKLDPKGYHVMFIDLKQPLVESETFKLTLNFEKAGIKEVDVVVTPIGGKKKKSHDSHSDGHDHGSHDHGAH